MAFNRQNPAHLATLKAEVANDPGGQNYAAVAGDTRRTLELLNDPAQNVGGDTIRRPADEVTIPQIADVIDEAEYVALSAYAQEWVKMFIARPAGEPYKPYRPTFGRLFDAAGATRVAIAALRDKPASRAELRFGVNTRIGREDWFAARDSS